MSANCIALNRRSNGFDSNRRRKQAPSKLSEGSHPTGPEKKVCPEVCLRMAKVERYRAIGKKGGEKVARLYGEDFFQSRSSKGGQACLARYGKEFYRAIRMMRETGK
jgi:hypothetical protein